MAAGFDDNWNATLCQVSQPLIELGAPASFSLDLGAGATTINNDPRQDFVNSITDMFSNMSWNPGNDSSYTCSQTCLRSYYESLYNLMKSSNPPISQDMDFSIVLKATEPSYRQIKACLTECENGELKYGVEKGLLKPYDFLYAHWKTFTPIFRCMAPYQINMTMDCECLRPSDAIPVVSTEHPGKFVKDPVPEPPVNKTEFFTKSCQMLNCMVKCTTKTVGDLCGETAATYYTYWYKLSTAAGLYLTMKTGHLNESEIPTVCRRWI